MIRRPPLLPRLADERGQSLVMAMLVLTVLAIALGSVIFFTSANQRNSAYQKASQVARSLAEAGVNNGISVLTNTQNTAYLVNDGSTPSVSPSLLPTRTSTYPGGKVQWWGTFSAAVADESPSCATAQDLDPPLACVGVWTVHATSTVTNPTGPTAAAIHRTATAKMQVYRLQNSNPADVWNWIYSPYSSGTGNCDTLFTNSLTIDVRVWVGGNLCLNNSVQLTRSTYVGGYLNVGNPQAGIGSQSAPVTEAYAGGGCWFLNNPFYSPCLTDGTIGPDGKPAKTHVWASTLYTPQNPIPPDETIFNNVTAPPLCWGLNDCPPDSANPPSGGWYSVASPGPLHPCDIASTSPAGNPLPPVADPDGLFNDSIPGVFNLTPDSYDYTCKTSGGELSWNRATRTLTIQGVVFIDGSATAYTSGNAPITYTGWGDNGQCTSIGSCQAVLFLSGTFLISREQLCAVVTIGGNRCDANAWDPNKKLLIIATHYKGGQVPANDGVNVTTNQASFQGGLYAVYSIDVSSGASVQGPLVSGTGTILDGQSGSLAFPTITISPFAINEPPALMLCDSSLPCRPFDYTG